MKRARRPVGWTGALQLGKLMTMLIAAVAICLGAFPPQGPETLRSKAFGVVLDLEGEPWSGAKVRLFSRPFGPGVRVGTLDSVDAETDERGRFRCSVLRGRAYSVWATGEDGRQSKVVEGVFAGDPTEVRETKWRNKAVRISVKGIEAWSKRGPLKWSLLTPTKNVIEVSGTLGEDGVVSAPPLPGSYLSLLLMDRDGRYLATHSVRGGGITKSVELAAPRKVRARFRSILGDKPVANGKLWWTGPDWQQRGRILVVDLDAEGRAEFELPAADDGIRHDAWSFRVTGQGCNTGIPVSSDERVEDSDEEAKAARDEGVTFLQCGLERGQDVKGRLLWKDGSPVARAPIVVRNNAHSQVSENSYYGGQDVWTIETDDEGRFVAPGVRGESSTTLELVLTDEIVAKLPAAWRGKVRPLGLLGVVSKVRRRKRRTVDQDFGDLVLDRDFWPLDLEMRTPDGLPAVGASVVMRSPGIDAHATPVESAGRLGRFCMLVPREAELHIGVLHEQSARMEALEFTAKPSVEAPHRIRFQLESTRKLVVRVRDPDGKPVSGARVSLGPSWQGRVALPERAEAPASSDAVVVESVELETDDFTNLLWTILGRLSTRTDSEGVATLFVPDLDISIEARAHHNGGGKSRHGRATVVLGDHEGVIELSVHLGK